MKRERDKERECVERKRDRECVCREKEIEGVCIEREREREISSCKNKEYKKAKSFIWMF